MKLTSLLSILLLSILGYSQCDNGTNYYPSSIYTPSIGSWGYASTCNWAGEVIQVNITSGDTYQFSTCDNYGGVLASYDTQLTLYDGSGTVVAFNDDYFGCSGYSSYINWTATYTGVLYVHLNEYNCVTNMTCTRVMIYRTEQQQPGPCTNSAYYTVRDFPTLQNPTETIGCYYAGDYCTWNNPEQDVSYLVESTNPTDWITVRSGTYDGTVVAVGNTPIEIISATAGETYYIHVNTNDLCVVESICRDVRVTRQSALPVELLFFSGEVKEEINLIKWATASEYNSDYFLVEHSSDGNEWRQLSKVYAMGYSNIYTEYILWDCNVLPITNYYRLLQFDYDGQHELFGPIAIDNRKSSYRIIKHVDIMGREINLETTKGIVFEVYEDGTSRKVFKY